VGVLKPRWMGGRVIRGGLLLAPEGPDGAPAGPTGLAGMPAALGAVGAEGREGWEGGRALNPCCALLVIAVGGGLTLPGGRGCIFPAGPAGAPGPDMPPGPSNRGRFAGGNAVGDAPGAPMGRICGCVGPDGARLSGCGWYGRLGPAVGPGLGEGRTGENPCC